MSGKTGGLLLPGEGRRGAPQVGRVAVGAATGLSWLVFQSSVLPFVGVQDLPMDPLIPLIAAFVLGAQRNEGFALAVLLGLVADSLSGVASGATTLQYLAVVALAAPLEGHIVLRDRWLPAAGIGVLCLVSGLGVLAFTGLLGVGRESPWLGLPQEAFGTAVATALLWPLFRRIAGWRNGGPLELGSG